MLEVHLRKNSTGELLGLLFYFIFMLQLAWVSGSRSTYVYGEPKYKCPEKPNIIYPCVCTKGSDDGIYIRCNNTNLAMLSVSLQNLAALDIPVEEIIVYKAHIRRLYGPIFSKIRARLLRFEDTPLETIEDYAFYGINKTVEQVYLLGTNLSRITPLSFGILGKTTHLIIDGHSLENLDKNLFLGQEITNKIEVLRIINGALREFPPEAFQHLRKLKTLDVHGNQLENLKRNQFKNLRDLEVLDISFNKIKKLEAQHIADLTKLGWCNASNNALTELSRGTFARNSVLKLLNLSNNKISKLDTNSFRGMRFLRRLYLSDNRISDIGRGTFGSLTRIGTIDLARNALKKIEYQMFSQLNYVEILNIAENNVTVVEKNSFKDIYQATINISHNALERIESHAFENCVNITVLDLSFNRLKNFSKNAFDLTTFATEFQLSYNELTDMAQIPIQNMTGIKIVNASHNHITQIPKNCFPKLYELHTVDVSHNNISIIFNGVFQTLFSLRFLNISHNSLEEIKSSVFGTLPTLLELDLSHNNLNSIVRGALAKLTSLRFMDLSYNKLEKIFQIPISLNELLLNNNKISAIPAGTWPVMNSLIFLDLSNNQIGDELDENSFTGLLVLQRLKLQSNGITKPPIECLAGMTTLQYLHLEHNNITQLEKSAFGKLPVLFELHLYNNGVKDISKRAFEGLLQLLTLNLSMNAISNIPNDAFIGLPSLRKLDLSYNSLTKLDNKTNGVLDDLLSLERLNLSHNKISFVTKKTFPSHQYIPYNLKYLDLSFNQMPVLTYDITFGTKKLLELDLSHNRINELRRGVLGNFTALRYLDLSHNELTNLVSEEHIFDIPKNLTEIYLNDNQIYRLPIKKFNKSPRFNIIDLRNNNMIDFPPELVKCFRNGTKVLYSGNPLHCDCSVRPLKHLTLEITDLSEDIRKITCATPNLVAGQNFVSVGDENLFCTAEGRDTYKSDEFAELPDVRFRDIKVDESAGNLTVRWFVTSPKDVADFTVFIRSTQNEVLYQAEILYNLRKVDIPLLELRKQTEKLVGAEICVVSKNSEGMSGRWYSSQCEKMPMLKPVRSCTFCFKSDSSKMFNGTQYVVVLLSLLVLFDVFKFYLS